MLKMWVNFLLSVLLAALCLKVNAYPSYQLRIPNGDKIPNPCDLSTIWPGVGHQNSSGGGPRNPFGLDFYANNKTWNETLCEMDSDGDGMTNGQELGDPNCTWTMGSNSTLNSNLSHPGVCEPVDSPYCTTKNSWMTNCGPEKFNCSAINEPGVRNYTVRFPVTPVPAKETTYICHKFALPNDSASDIIAFEPVIDNAHIVHHMMLYACTEEPTDHPTDEPFECQMTVESCQSLIGIWRVGVAGQCLNSQLGFRIGPGGFQYAVLQLHWNNPGNVTNLTDSSGLRIYDTTQLRPNRGQIAIVGQTFIEIPPHQAEVTLTGACSSLCTAKHFPQSIFLTSVLFHMHNLGKSGDVRLSRNGELVQILESVTHYDYNTPILRVYETPIEVKPGDEIQVKCVYDSTQRNSATHYGEATSDEMCYGFFAYYPLIEGLGFCEQWKNISTCNDEYDAEFGPCDINTLVKLNLLLSSVCAENCTSTPCSVIIDGMLATRCQNYPDVMGYIEANFPDDNGAMFERCAKERPPKPSSTTQGPQCTVSHSSGHGSSLYFGFILTLMAYATHE